MKRIVAIILFFICISHTAVADVVTPDVAARCAHALFGKSLSVAPKSVSNRAIIRGVESSVPEYYVFNNPDGGWILISAEDKVYPVIAYSESGYFDADDLPVNVEWWMNGVSSTIKSVRESDSEANAAVLSAWNTLLNQNGAPDKGKKELNTALWNQFAPYNDYCPIVAGENKRSVTGCVATAMAIVARYYMWPEYGKGVIGGYTTSTLSTYIPPYSIDNHKYDWSQMPLSDGGNISSGWTEDQKRQVAQLMYDCGVMVNMDYSYSDGSGAFSESIPQAIQENLSYSKSSTNIYRSAYTLEKWFGAISDEIADNRVVLYSGSGSAGGHAFVCDGYDTDGYKLHFNWGWGGAYNGYFTLDLTLYDGLQLNNNQTAVIGICPENSEVVITDIPDLMHYVYDGLTGLKPISGTDMTEGSEVSFDAGWFYVSPGSEGSYEFKICLMDENGEVLQEGWPFSIDLTSEYIYSEESEKNVLNVTPSFTDYFRLFYKKGDSEWRPVAANSESLPDADGICCGITPDPVILLPVDCMAGTQVELKLTMGYAPVKSVVWYLNGSILKGNEAKLKSGENQIKAEVVYTDDTDGTIFRTITVE